MIKRTWKDGSDYFYQIVDATQDELLACEEAANSRTWIEANAEIVDTRPALRQRGGGQWDRGADGDNQTGHQTT